MVGLSAANWGTSSLYWRSTAAVGRSTPIMSVSRTQPQAAGRPVTPVAAVPAVNREQPGTVSWIGAARSGYGQGADPVEMAVRGRIQYLSPEEVDTMAAASKSAREVMEEAECQTCRQRKYQDGSNDPGVSFKTPTNVAPEQAASAVRGHEQEHVVREQARAQRENREVVSQSVTYHTAICPECGKVYISGGTTRTSTRAVREQPALSSALRGRQLPFSAIA